MSIRISEKEIKNVIKKYPPDDLFQILQALSHKYHYLSEKMYKCIHKYTGKNINEIYSVASFFSFLNTDKPLGKYIIRVCKTISCELAGKQDIINTLQDELQIKVGETTYDGKFSILTTNCLGLCNNGPAMLINDEVYYNLTPDKVRKIISDYKAKEGI